MVFGSTSPSEAKEADVCLKFESSRHDFYGFVNVDSNQNETVLRVLELMNRLGNDHGCSRCQPVWVVVSLPPFPHGKGRPHTR